MNCTPLVSSPRLHLGARGRLLPARAPSAPAPEESPQSCATTSVVQQVPPTSTSTAGTGLAIVCASKTSNLVQSTTNLKKCNRTKSIVRGVWFPRRECARTVRSSSKASNPTFQPLIGSQEPTPEVLVPVIKLLFPKPEFSRSNSAWNRLVMSSEADKSCLRERETLVSRLSAA